MAKTLSDDLRKRVVEAVDGGQSRRAAAEQFNIGVATAIRWVNRYRLSGSWAAKKRGSPKGRSPLDAYSDDILALLEEKADITLEEIVVYLRETFGLETSKSSVDRFFTRCNVTFKKRQRTPVSRNART
jgi:transposase